MMDTVLLIDSCTDLPRSYVDKNEIPFVSLVCNFKDQEYKDDFGKSISYRDFFDAVRNGEMPSTAQVNVYEYTEIFKKYAAEGKSVVYLGFSSALSGSLSSAYIARDTVMEEFKDADITIVDSKSASLGEGLLAYYANEMLKAGASKDEVVSWLETNKLKMNHWFTVDDLGHLKRGGRLSGTAAFLGTLLDIKPVLKVDDEGRLIPISKVKGRKKSIKTLFEMLQENITAPEEQVIAISHGDCIEDAEYLKEMILKEYNVKDVIINHVGPVIGAHTGPGVVALFFMGEKR
ncbi:MAG TPA: DegV family protein [Bacillota bacterium]|jgi:DegV family protein with EDD domain|nr:DegV family protein [Bacillota bacterium]HQL36449.1 DegV family protein [Bacillota bacterium]HRS21658.1 DegV family protein [Clostridia bacterium]